VTTQERRLHPRFPLQAPVQFKVRGKKVEATTLDASHGGFFVRADQTPPVGSVIQFQLEIAPSHTLKLAGEVRHISQRSDRAGMGVKIMRLMAGSETAFEAYQTQILEMATNAKTDTPSR
jgi:hypothetical protein